MRSPPTIFLLQDGNSQGIFEYSILYDMGKIEYEGDPQVMWKEPAKFCLRLSIVYPTKDLRKVY